METRTLPRSEEAEKSVLGGILIENSMYEVAAGIIQPSDFYYPHLRVVYECIGGLLSRSTVADLVTVVESLTRNGKIGDANGPAAVASLTDGVPRSTNVASYADIVKKKALTRRLIFDAGDLLSRAYAEELPASELAHTAIKTFTAIEAGGVPAEVSPVIVTLGNVRPEAIRWLWPGRIAIGKLTMLSGDPGLGKSFITMDLAARASTGRQWPDGSSSIGAIDVLVLAAEDGLADTVRPRLDALGADVSKIHVMTGTKERGAERGPQLADVEAIEAAIIATGARLLVIDPVSSYLGVTDSHRDSEVRGLLTPLLTMAERNGCAVLGVMHLTKDGGKSALYRTSGSVAFVAQARVALMVTSDSENPERRVLAASKCNVAKTPEALGYSMHEGVLRWEDAPLADFDLNAHLAAASTSAGRDKAEHTDADRVLADLLADESIWPLPATEAYKAAKAHGIHDKTLKRAADRAGVRISKLGYQGQWIWSRPRLEIKEDTKADSSLDTETVSPLSPLADHTGKSGHTHKEDSNGPFPRARETRITGGGKAHVEL